MKLPNLAALDARVARLAGSTALVAVLYWGIYRMPLPVAGEGLVKDDAELLAETARTMRRYARWDKAVGPLERLHAAYPESHAYMRDLAEVYRELHRYEDEARMWAAFLDASPAPEEACPRAGHAWKDAGQPEQMFTTLDRCAELSPSDPDMRFHIAQARERWGDSASAESAYLSGLERFPASSDLQLGLARIRLRQGRHGEALEAARRVLAASPGNPDALLVAGLGAKATGDLATARQYLERGATASPRYADIHVALADVASRLADLDSARDHYRQAIEADPGNREARLKLEALGRL